MSLRAAPDVENDVDDAVVALDVGDAAGGDRRALDDLARGIDAACRATGFFGVVDGSLAELRREVLELGEQFFALPGAVKGKYRVVSPSGVQRGYAGLGAEAQAAAVGTETLPDLSETFSIAPLRSSTPRDRWSVGDTWPDEIPALRPALSRYREAVDALGRTLLRACALALHGDAGALDALVTRPLGGLRINHYPALSDAPAPGQWRGGAHTDYGTLTVLATDRIAGLEIEVAGTWVPVTAPPDGFLVNVGDILSTLSRGRWPSTWHRVTVPSGRGPFPSRTSVAFFQYPNADAVIAGLGNSGDQRAGDYLQDKVSRIGAAGLYSHVDPPSEPERITP